MLIVDITRNICAYMREDGHSYPRCLAGNWTVEELVEVGHEHIVDAVKRLGLEPTLGKSQRLIVPYST
jgi:hypothetical protein